MRDFDDLTPDQLDAEVASATRGLRLHARSRAELDAIAGRHALNRFFASRVIKEAVRRERRLRGLPTGEEVRA